MSVKDKSDIVVEPQTQANENDSEKETNDSNKGKNEILVPVKFNKETRNLTLEEAAELAQKGLKFEMIEKDYKALKELAQEQGQSVPKFLETIRENFLNHKKTELTEKCGGNTEIAEHILALEKNNSPDNGFAELKEYFPEIKTPSDLPEKVLNSAALKGTLLLDEYLRYLLNEEKVKKESLALQKQMDKSSTGSLSNRSGAQSPETEEFLKGLWN